MPDGYEFNQTLLSHLKDKIPNPLWEALYAIIEAAENYGSSYKIEISKSNLGVSQRGRLILRDVIFDMTLVEKIRRRNPVSYR